MNYLEINVGLNVGSIEPSNQSYNTIEELSKMFNFGVHDFRIDTGEWWTKEEGEVVERTLVVGVDGGKLTSLSISLILTNIAIILNQDAIAFRLNGEGYMVYNPKFEGVKVEFKEEFFNTL